MWISQQSVDVSWKLGSTIFVFCWSWWNSSQEQSFLHTKIWKKWKILRCEGSSFVAKVVVRITHLVHAHKMLLPAGHGSRARRVTCHQRSSLQLDPLIDLRFKTVTRTAATIGIQRYSSDKYLLWLLLQATHPLILMMIEYRHWSYKVFLSRNLRWIKSWGKNLLVHHLLKVVSPRLPSKRALILKR